MGVWKLQLELFRHFVRGIFCGLTGSILVVVSLCFLVVRLILLVFIDFYNDMIVQMIVTKKKVVSRGQRGGRFAQINDIPNGEGYKPSVLKSGWGMGIAVLSAGRWFWKTEFR